MKNFNDLTEPERKALMLGPVYITLLTSNIDGKLDDMQEKSAVDFSHIKTYSCAPILRTYYNLVDKDFKKNLKIINDALPKVRATREFAIKAELAKLGPILAKMDNEFAVALHRSFHSFAEHVSRAHHSLLVSFIIPFNIKGINY